MSSDNYSHIHTEPSGLQRADVWRMFDRIAPTYDLVNRLLSFGLDIRWRKKVATHMPAERDMVLLDLATGTGDQVISLTQTGRFTEAVGMDIPKVPGEPTGLRNSVPAAEACTGGCCEMQNKYDVIDMANGNKLFEIQEKSPNCERCCCAPYHPT